MTPADKRQWREIAEQLLTSLRTLQHTIGLIAKGLPIEPRINAVPEDSNAEERPRDENPEQPFLFVRAVNSPNPAREAHDDANNDRDFGLQRSMLRWQKALCVATFAAFLAAAYYALVAKQQKDTMDKTLGEIKQQTGYGRTSSEGATKAAKAAQDALDLARSNFQADERPWVFTNAVIPEPQTARDAQGRFAAGQLLYWRIYHSNYGRSPALKFIGNARLFHGPRAAQQADAYFMRLPSVLTGGTVGILPPGGPPPPAPVRPGGEAVEIGQRFTTVTSARPLTPEDVNYIYTHDFSIYIVGRFQYEDIIGGKTYGTDFCTSTFVTGAINNCRDRHNEAH